EAGNKSSSTYAGYFENTSGNTGTNGINRYGLYVASTGAFAGSTGTDTSGYGIYIASTTGADTNYDIYAASGAYLSTGGTWTNASSRELKENFSEVDTQEILQKINQLDLSTWNYKSEQNSVKHLGPIAEDFYSLFKLGNSSKSISTIDPAGVALAGIQALSKKVNNLESTYTSVNDEGDISLQTSGEEYSYNGIIDPELERADTYTVLFDNKVVDSVKAFGTVVSSKLKTGLLDTQNAIVRNKAFVNKLSANSLSVASKVTSPLIQTSNLDVTNTAKAPSIKTNEVTALDKDIVLNIDTASEGASLDRDKGELAKVIIRGLEGRAVTTIDSVGNIITDGNITSQTASISGSLVAATASISGELVADNIRSKTIDQINEKISSSNTNLSSINNQVNDVQKLLAELHSTSITETSPLEKQLLLSMSGTSLPDNTTVDNFSVTGAASLFKATITDSLFVGNLIVKSNSLLSLNADLNISSLGSVSFFENAVTIAKDGSITATGQINAPALAIKDTHQQTVASINNQGKATFKELSLEKYLPDNQDSTVIAASDNLVRNGQYTAALETTRESAGIGLVPARSREVILYNDSITDSSLVYLTPTSSTAETTLSVVEKHTCGVNTPGCRPYFKVGANREVSSKLTFNWLIIN
ncbi:MAG: tail fiber domain-containing protein, partial [Patescibacteria group bacterium]